MSDTPRADGALEALAEAVFCACWLRWTGIGDRCIPPFAARDATHWVGVPRWPEPPG